MKSLILIGLLIGFISTSVFAKTKVLTFNPKSDAYTNVVQDIAVFQESCQNHVSGHYQSKMYEYDFHHDSSGNCIVSSRDSGDPVIFRVVMDDDAKHVIKNMTSLNGDSVTCDVRMNSKNMDNYYAGTCAASKILT